MRLRVWCPERHGEIDGEAGRPAAQKRNQGHGGARVQSGSERGLACTRDVPADGLPPPARTRPGLAKTQLGHVATAAAITTDRAAAWVRGERPGQARTSRFAARAA